MGKRKKSTKRPDGMTARSYNMSQIKGKDTKAELLLRKELWHRGLRYRKNCALIYGKPDIVFLRKKVAVFVDGGFWHGYNYEQTEKRIKSNKEYWTDKIETNRERDFQITMFLAEEGWAVLRFWDFEVKDNLKECADKVEKTVRNREIE